jgi:hypothetical protein
MSHLTAIAGSKFAALARKNPSFDLLQHDFFLQKAAATAGLNELAQADIETLKCYQRLLRLFPDSLSPAVADKAGLADRLVDLGLHSAHHIAQTSEQEFVSNFQARLCLSDGDTRLLHRQAVQTKLRAQLAAFALHGSAGSALFRAGAMDNTSANLIAYVDAIPSYQDFFGSLDYCQCDPDQSIYSPSAYLTDMLRIVYQFIDNATFNPGIPAGWHFAERRPDIGRIPLTPAMTRDLVPYLQIVNEVVEAEVGKAAGWSDVFRAFAAQPYPFVLPFILPLTSLRVNMRGLGTSLLNAYTTFQARADTPPASQLPGPEAIGREALGLSPTTQAIVMTALSTATSIGPYYGIDDGRLLTFTASGTVSVTKDSTAVTGTGTSFLTEIKVGDDIQVGAQRVRVTAIADNLNLTVETAWLDSAKGTMLVFPPADLATSLIFCQRTALAYEALEELLRQNLSDGERDAGVATKLFVNQGLTASTCLTLVVDQTDPNSPVSRIANLDLAALDRLIRLANASGIAFSDLDWLVETLGAGTIDAAAITAIGRARDLADRLGSSIQETIGIFQPLKTIGVAEAGRPADIFDQLFNAASILGSPAGSPPAFSAKGTVSVTAGSPTVTGSGTAFKQQIAIGMRIRLDGDVRVVSAVTDDVTLTVSQNFAQAASTAVMVVLPSAATPSDALPIYHPLYAANPTYEDIIVDWLPTATSTAPQVAGLRSRLRAGLRVGDDELTAIGLAALSALKASGAVPQAATTIPLSVANMSLLYGYAKLARQCGLTVSEYLTLLQLMGVAAASDLDTTCRIAEQAALLKQSGLNVFALNFTLTGNVSKNYTPVFAEAALPNFLAALWQTAQSWLVLANDFINQDIDAAQSASYFAQLSDPKAGFLSPHGAVLAKAVDFAAIAFIDPLVRLSFTSPIITADQSGAAFDALVAHQVLSAGGVLSATFSETTDLSYLFPGEPNQQAMIAVVRSVLMATQARIAYVLSVLLTYGGVPTVAEPNRGVQLFHLSEQLGVALSIDTGTVMALGPLVATSVGLDDYVSAFLMPFTGTVPTLIEKFVTLMSRAATLVNALALSANDVTFMAEHPEPFHITTLDKLNLGSVFALWTYQSLRQTYDDADGRLPAYFATPAGKDCATDPKMQKLALMISRPVEQICMLRAALYGTGTAYDTVEGVAAMVACFQAAQTLGLDVQGTLAIARLNALPATIDTAAWSAYSNAATATIGSLQAAYGGAQWETIYRPIEDAVNEAKRDALVPFAIFHLGQQFPVIDSPNSLYSYLLIDVEMGGCADISYIAQAMLSVQLYMQRARMMLEPGITKLAIPEVWWSWLGSFPYWQANRKVFLYPENYLEPGLRQDKTAEFKTFEDSMTSNEITPATVNDAYVAYFDSFTSLAALKRVGAYEGIAPDPNALGVQSPTLYLISRTATEPYTYYMQRKVNDLTWTAFEKIDLSIASPLVAPLYAFDRLFMFWVEQDVAAVSQIQGGTAQDSTDTKAALKYSFINYSGKWVSPQTIDRFPIDFAPMQGGYSTPQIDPATFDVNQLQWQTVTPFLIKGTNGNQDTILVNYGQFYDLPTNTTVPLPPVRAQVPNADAFTVASDIYNSSVYAIGAVNQGIRGATFVNKARLLLESLNVSPTNVVAGAYNLNPSAPKPYVPVIPRRVLPSGQQPVLTITDFSNAFLINYVGEGASYTWMPTDSLVLLYNISDRAGFTSPVVNQPLWFLWDNGNETFLIRSTEPGIKRMEDYCHANAGDQTNQTNLISGNYTDSPIPFQSIVWSAERLSTGAAGRLNQALFAGGVPRLMLPQTQITPIVPSLPFTRFYDQGVQPTNIDPPHYLAGDTIDYNGPYGPYFWDIYLYCPWLVANQLRSNQQFAEARSWLEYIFNPTIPINSDPTVADQKQRFWRLVKFRDFTVESLQQILTDKVQIQAYNNYPFQPHVIAKLRGSAYQKAIVMRYIDILIEWGDSEFTKDTWETITQATLLYILARDLLGPRPVDVGACSTQPPATFNDIQAKYGTDIPQFLIDMENVSPGLTQATPRLDEPDRFVPFNDLDAYFCVPENSQLAQYWDIVDDRLFKIRHCMNIQGIVRQLALFSPPIDPMALVRAAAAGLGPKVVDQLQSGAPPYRFTTIFSLASDYTAQLSQLGGQLLAALEKKDSEALARLNSGQQIQILNLTTRSMELQIAEVQEQINGLTISLKAATARRDFWQSMVDTGLSPAEKLQIAMAVLSNVFSLAGGILEGIATGAFLVPDAGSPFAMVYGGREIGSSLHAAALISDFAAQVSKGTGDLSAMIGGFERREQDWQLQLTQAGYDAQVLDSQILGAQLHLQTMQQQMAIHRKTLANAAEVDDFMRRKFTNAELYQWMIARLSTVYGQAYRMALELAVSAQQAYQFETNSNEQFVTFDYWDGNQRGLLAGEQLNSSLAQMGASYHRKNNRRLDIEKTISLLALDPLAFLTFQSTGACDIRLSEYLFDLDYPGLYARQIKSVAVTIPSIVAPNQNIKATLTQYGSQTLIKPDIDGVEYLLGLGTTTPDSSVLRANWRVSQKIALSTGVDDSGLFQLDLNDERYLPFEGTGAVSTWRLEMPLQTNRLNYAALTDVIIKLRYSASDGGTDFARKVRDKVNTIPYRAQAAFNLATNFPTAWYAFLYQPQAAAQVFDGNFVIGWFPPNLKIGQVTEVYAMLRLAPGIKAGGSMAASLTLGPAGSPTTVPLTFDATRGIAQATGLTISGWIDQPWTLNIAKTNIPSGLKDTNTGFIDPSKLLSIALMITYSADRP